MRTRQGRSWLGAVTLDTCAVFVPAVLVFVLIQSIGYSTPNDQPRASGLHCPASPFISAWNSALCVDGRPLRLIGYNWHWMGTGCSPPTDATIESTFAEI